MLQYGDSRLTRHCCDGPLSLYVQVLSYYNYHFLAHPVPITRCCGLMQDGQAVMQCFSWGVGEGETVFFIVLIARVWILCAVRLHQRLCLWIPATLSVARLSPTARSHTRQQCRHARLDGRLLQGCIRLHKLYSIFLQPPSLCMHPPSHPSASALTVHTAVKFSVSPCFMLACSSRISRFLYLRLDALLNICGYLLFFFFFFRF